MRIFTAFDIPPKAKSEILKITQNLQALNAKGINWVPFENLHITLQFIGETTGSELLQIQEILASELSECPEFKCEKAELQFFPGRNPKIIWLHLQTDSELVYTIQKRIQKQLRSLGIQIDKKPLKLHITLGRIKKRLPDYFIKQVLSKEYLIADFVVSQATLYQSFLRPQGPVYVESAKFDLRNRI
jgi:RNA 2',3'-cyclic 3'-phosphodiesterase